MKILLAAPFDSTVLGMITQYSVKALREMGHEVSVFDFRRHPYSNNKLASCLKEAIRSFLPKFPSPYDIPAVRGATDQVINRLFLDRVFSYKPDLVLVYCGENIVPETIEKIKKAGIITVNWFHDSMVYPVRQGLVHSVLPVYDYCFMVDSPDVLKVVSAPFKNIFSLSLACDPQIHRKMALSERDRELYGSDVVFVGTVSPEREAILESLSDFDLNIWGIWGKESARLKKRYKKKYVHGEELVKIYNASKIVLDIHALWNTDIAKTSGIFNVTPRLFEVPSCGGFLLANNIPQVFDLYEKDKEIVVYGDVEDLKTLIRYYLDHSEERARIAQAAYQKVHGRYTYRHRLEELIRISTGGAVHGA